MKTFTERLKEITDVSEKKLKADIKKALGNLPKELKLKKSVKLEFEIEDDPWAETARFNSYENGYIHSCDDYWIFKVEELELSQVCKFLDAAIKEKC